MAQLGKSAETRILLDGSELQPPVDWFDIEVLATFDNEVQANVTTDEFEFILSAYTRLKDKILAGLTGGVGIFEPVPISIQAVSTLGTIDAFEGGVVLKDSTINDTNGRITAPIEKNNAIRTLDERLSGLSYLYLLEKGHITASDYFDVDYVVDKPDKALEAVITSITIYSLARELIDLIRQIAKDAAIIAGIAPSGLTGPVGAAVYAAASIVVNVAYSAAILALLIQLASELVRAFALPLRTHKAMKLKKLLERACSWLGYGFNTTITDLDNVVYLPSNPVLDIGDNNRGFLSQPGTIERGIPNANDYGYICSEMFQLARNAFNARYQLINGVVQFHSENSPYWIRNSTYVLPDVLENSYRYNTDELKDSVLIRFTTDKSDLYTLDEYKGTAFQVITDAQTVGASGRDNITGLDEVALPVSLGSRKDDLNGFERFLATLGGVIDGAVNTFGGNSNIAGELQGKVGVLRVSQNNHAVPKLLWYVDDRLPVNHRDLFSARSLWDKYHSYKSFLSNNFKRQRKVYEGVSVPFGFSDFTQLIDNSYFLTQDGRRGKVLKCTWNMNRDKAEIDYWIEEIYTKNLQETYIEPTRNGAITTTS